MHNSLICDELFWSTSPVQFCDLLATTTIAQVQNDARCIVRTFGKRDLFDTIDAEVMLLNMEAKQSLNGSIYALSTNFPTVYA